MTPLSGSQVSFQANSFCDRHGRVFTWEGQLYRGLTPAGLANYRRLVEEGLLARLIELGLLVETEETDLRVEGFELILKHRRLPFVSYAAEWSPRMLRDAVITLARLELELVRHGWTINCQDAEFSNLLFDGTRPVYVDFGALVPDSPEMEQFCRADFEHCVHPARQALAGRGRLVRALLCPGHEDMVLAIEARESSAGPMEKLRSLDRRIRRRVKPPRQGARRIEMMKNAIRELESAPLMDFPSSNSEAVAEFAEIATLISQLQPRSVLLSGDFGEAEIKAAAGLGTSELVVCDPSEVKIDQLYEFARAQNVKLLPLVMDFRYPTPGAGVCQREYPAAAARLACEMLAAIGVVEHLVFRRFLGFDQVAATLADFSKQYLAVAFRGPDFGAELRQMASDAFFHWYSLENFERALSQHFRVVESRRLPAAGSHLIFCQKAAVGGPARQG